MLAASKTANGAKLRFAKRGGRSKPTWSITNCHRIVLHRKGVASSNATQFHRRCDVTRRLSGAQDPSTDPRLACSGGRHANVPKRGVYDLWLGGPRVEESLNWLRPYRAAR